MTNLNCEQCEWRPFVASLKEPDGPEGFSPLPDFAGYVKRCRACRDAYLDEQRRIDEHRAAMQFKLGPCMCPQCERDRDITYANRPPVSGSVAALQYEADQRELSGYQQALDVMLRNMVASLAAMFGALPPELWSSVVPELCPCSDCVASRAGKPEPLPDLKPDSPPLGVEQVTYPLQRVGSTDICGKCGKNACEHLSDAFFRAPTPAELAENEKFAAEFMGRVIPGITCAVDVPMDMAILSQPYRTFLITGILPPDDLSEPGVACRTCGAMSCTKNHAEFM